MAHYAVGDLQGCYREFKVLLDKVAFNPSRDHLYLVGDLIARGPDSLACMEHVANLGNSVTVTLGNHDLHFLACLELNLAPNPKDKLSALFQSPNLPQYQRFLKSQPLAVYLDEEDIFISHAGIHPNWSVEQALVYAKEAEAIYRSVDSSLFFQTMYGKNPTGFALEHLSKEARFKSIINVFTRMRFLHHSGMLDLAQKGAPNQCADLAPWFNFKRFEADLTQYIFGHWAALEGKTNKANIIALDTGCVWGGKMTMINLRNKEQIVSN